MTRNCRKRSAPAHDPPRQSQHRTPRSASLNEISPGLFCFRLSLLEFPGGEECPVVAPIVGGPSAGGRASSARARYGGSIFCEVVSTSSAFSSLDSIASIETIRRSGWVTIARRATFSMRLRRRAWLAANPVPRMIRGGLGLPAGFLIARPAEFPLPALQQLIGQFMVVAPGLVQKHGAAPRADGVGSFG